MYLADGRDAPAVVPHRGRRWAAVPGTVLALGAVSLITDVSAEMITAVLPLYLVSGLGLSPLGFGVLDGVYNGVGALVRLAGGHLADGGGGRHKAVAVAGYGLSALCKPLLLIAHTLPVIGAVLALDRTGKGLRTAPRDALISLAATPERRGQAFGVHRAMDTAGALCGPSWRSWCWGWRRRVTTPSSWSVPASPCWACWCWCSSSPAVPAASASPGERAGERAGERRPPARSGHPRSCGCPAWGDWRRARCCWG
ncbi:MFS transporter [Microbispora sp. H10830]|uniref:MFS transporter n=1 Tax=Microbispora sp. H10830 TaxID=2729109 RepID=UPI001C728FBF|nr:MFS transporter [Microbispora sp. H10830]